jgi:hypothetical protein
MRQNLQDHDTITAEARLRAYLDALDKPVASLGNEVRQDWRSEAEQHLRSLIAAHEELGSTHAEAVAEALAQFSRTPKRTGWQVSIAALRAAPDTSVIQLVARAVTQTFLIAGVSFAALGGAAIWYVTSESAAAASLLHAFSLSGFFLTPMVCGGRIGQLVAAWQATAETRSASTWRRPAADRFPMSARHDTRFRDLDMVPWIALGAVTISWLVGTLFAVCSAFFGASPYLPSASWIDGIAWLPMTAVFALISWAIRRRDFRSAASAAARIGDGR